LITDLFTDTQTDEKKQIIVLWPLNRSTCVSWQLYLTTGGICWSKV